MNLVPRAGIAFLWLIGVLRDRPGEREDRPFAAHLLGSGVLFPAMIVLSAAMAGGLIMAYAVDPDLLLGSPTFTFARVLLDEITNLYAINMEGVFMFVTSSLARRTRFLARWIAFPGHALALVLGFSGRYVEWIVLAFPRWVRLVSLDILFDNLRSAFGRPTTVPGSECEYATGRGDGGCRRASSHDGGARRRARAIRKHRGGFR